SVAQLRALLNRAAAAGTSVCGGHQLLFEAPMRELHRWRAALGRVVHVESYFSFRTVRRSPDGRTPLAPDLQLMDILPHPVYLLLAGLDPGGAAGPAQLTALELGPGGTLHAMVRKSGVTGSLT